MKSGAETAGYFIIIPFSVLAVFFLLPVFSILRSITLSDFAGVLSSSYYRSIIFFTFLQAAASTVFAVIAGLPGAWIMSHVDFKGKRFINSLTTVPFVLPSVLVVLGFVLSFGNNGILNTLLMKISGSETPPLRILYSFKAIILAHTFYNFPVALRLISTSWKNIGESRIHAAEILGAGKVRTFLTIVLPALLPSIIASASLIFIFCFMSFAVILVLGGGPAFTTLEVEIYRLARISVDLKAAASLSLTGAILTSFFTFIYIKLQKHASADIYSEVPVAPVKIKKTKANTRFFMILYIIFIVILILGPLAAVVYRSFQTRTGWSGNMVFSAESYLKLFSNKAMIRSILNSVLIAAGTMAAAIPAGLIAAYVTARSLVKYSSAAETLFMMPMGVSAIVIGLGYYSFLSFMPDNFSGTGIIIVLAHSVISLPFVVKTLSTGIRSINKSLIEASNTLGAGFLRTFTKVEFPLMKGSLISAAAFAFCISAGEVNAALILSESSGVTIPVSIYRLISSYRFFTACAMGTVLMIICAAAFYLIDRYGGDEIL